MEVCALGAVAFPDRTYNAFARQVFAIKRRHLGAVELTDAEMKGNSVFARAAFRRRESGSGSSLLTAADEVFSTLPRHGARVFTIWTSNPAHASLRSASTTALSKPYKQLLYDFRALARREGNGGFSHLLFDERSLRDDETAACTITNYLVRTDGDWGSLFVQMPTFVASSASPGLQVADLISYLGPHRADPSWRPELAAYIAKADVSRYEFRDASGRLRRCTRSIS